MLQRANRSTEGKADSPPLPHPACGLDCQTPCCATGSAPSLQYASHFLRVPKQNGMRLGVEPLGYFSLHSGAHRIRESQPLTPRDFWEAAIWAFLPRGPGCHLLNRWTLVSGSQKSEVDRWNVPIGPSRQTLPTQLVPDRVFSTALSSLKRQGKGLPPPPFGKNLTDLTVS